MMKYVMPVRKELGFRTIFNLLGPLLNPLAPDFQIMGVYDGRYCLPIAKSLLKLGVKRGMVVSGEDGLDEISLCAKTKIVEFDETKGVREYDFHPREVGFQLCEIEQLASHSMEESSEVALAILSGEERGPKRDIVVLNAAAGLKIYRKMTSLEEAIPLVEEALKRDWLLKRSTI